MLLALTSRCMEAQPQYRADACRCEQNMAQLPQVRVVVSVTAVPAPLSLTALSPSQLLWTH
jgi:hypothetical protein